MNDKERLKVKYAKAAVLSILFLLSTESIADFSGELVLKPDGCEKVRECYTKFPLHFVDSKGTEWEAKANLKTDGATIPIWAQPFIGEPYDKSFIKAAIVHDHYCDRHVRPWRQTHRVFYEMLQALGVPPLKSKLMYYAVFIGGPKWVELVPGKNCGLQCINTFNTLESAEKYQFEGEKYSSIKDIGEKLRNMETLLNKKDLTLDEIDKIAVDEFPNDFYYNTGNSYPYNPKIGIER